MVAESPGPGQRAQVRKFWRGVRKLDTWSVMEASGPLVLMKLESSFEWVENGSLSVEQNSVEPPASLLGGLWMLVLPLALQFSSSTFSELPFAHL